MRVAEEGVSRCKRHPGAHRTETRDREAGAVASSPQRGNRRPFTPENGIRRRFEQDRAQIVPDSGVPEVGKDDFQFLFTHGWPAEAQLQEPDFWFRERYMSGFHLPFRPESDIYTVQGWRNYVNQKPPAKPSQLSMDEYQALDDAERTAYDERRRLHIMHFGVLPTPDLTLNHDHLWNQFRVNFYSPEHTVRTGAVLDGDAGLGKTIIAKTLARRIEKYLMKVAAFNTPEDRGRFIPVVHVTFRALWTPRDLTEAICNFLGVTTTLPERTKDQQLLKVVCEAVHRHGVMLFVIDDSQFLEHAGTQNSDMVNFIRALVSRTGATFMYVGIDCERLELFRSPENMSPWGWPMTTRSMHLRVRPYTSADVSWNRLFVALESHLVLLKHEPGTLAGLDAYLFERTSGNIGSLMRLVQKATFRAIGTTERLDRAILEHTHVD